MIFNKRSNIMDAVNSPLVQWVSPNPHRDEITIAWSMAGLRENLRPDEYPAGTAHVMDALQWTSLSNEIKAASWEDLSSRIGINIAVTKALYKEQNRTRPSVIFDKLKSRLAKKDIRILSAGGEICLHLEEYTGSLSPDNAESLERRIVKMVHNN